MRSNPNARNRFPEEMPGDISDQTAGGLSDQSVSDRISRVRTHVAALRGALLSPAQSPGELMGCVPGLSKAAACLGAIEHRLKAQPAISIDHVRELKSLQAELSAVQKLIEHGAAFHRGWARLLGAAAAGYTSSGEAAPLAARGSLAMEG